MPFLPDRIQLKVCGLAHMANAQAVLQLNPDYLGFIFYPGSRRRVAPELVQKVSGTQSRSGRKVGVFVNEDKEKVKEIGRLAQVHVIQLHGHESVEDVSFLKEAGFEVWKAFGISPGFDMKELEPYANRVDAFLFDTAGDGYGGSGKLFNHWQLQDYHLDTPFWLSGGIGPDFLSLPQFFSKLPLLGLDLNSKFETEPGLKNTELLTTFFTHWQQRSYDNFFR